MSEQKIELLSALDMLKASFEIQASELSRAVEEYARVNEENKLLRAALVAVTDEYCQLANSGDAGFWNPEEVPSVILARAALNITSQKGGTNEK